MYCTLYTVRKESQHRALYNVHCTLYFTLYTVLKESRHRAPRSALLSRRPSSQWAAARCPLAPAGGGPDGAPAASWTAGPGRAEGGSALNSLSLVKARGPRQRRAAVGRLIGEHAVPLRGCDPDGPAVSTSSVAFFLQAKRS